jgi:regulator of sirC expression with transglutaminase-like and TPR domain
MRQRIVLWFRVWLTLRFAVTRRPLVIQPWNEKGMTEQQFQQAWALKIQQIAQRRIAESEALWRTPAERRVPIYF